jgi:hypothetical protein
VLQDVIGYCGMPWEDDGRIINIDKIERVRSREGELYIFTFTIFKGERHKLYQILPRGVSGNQP